MTLIVRLYSLRAHLEEWDLLRTSVARNDSVQAATIDRLFPKNCKVPKFNISEVVSHDHGLG